MVQVRPHQIPVVPGVPKPVLPAKQHWEIIGGGIQTKRVTVLLMVESQPMPRPSRRTFSKGWALHPLELGIVIKFNGVSPSAVIPSHDILKRGDIDRRKEGVTFFGAPKKTDTVADIAIQFDQRIR